MKKGCGSLSVLSLLQCFDTFGWVRGRASASKNLIQFPERFCFEMGRGKVSGVNWKQQPV